MNEEEWTVEGLYRECAILLNADHTYKKFPYRKKTRWNNRAPGNGRFIGHGLIRVFSLKCIIVSLYNPRFSGQFNNPTDALVALKEVIDAVPKPPCDV